MRSKEYELSEGNRFGEIRSYHSVLSPQKRVYNAHHHTQCEISVFLSGSGVYTVSEREYRFEPGSVFLFGSNEEHCITEISSDIDLLNVQFEPHLLWERQDAAEILTLLNARPREFENKITDSENRLKSRLLEIEGELCHKCPCYAVAARYSLFSALIFIVRHCACIDPTRVTKLSNSAVPGLRKVIDYIQQNLDERLTLDKLAAMACFSPNYFSHVFKRYNGVSLWEYITIKRVEKAIELLKTTTLTKLDIAERCGFSSASHFYQCFSSVTGKCPGDFTK